MSNEALSAERLAEILAATIGATAGPWCMVPSRDISGDIGIAADGLKNVMAEVFSARNDHREHSSETYPTAQLIANCDPQTVSSLVSELISAREAVDRLTRERDEWFREAEDRANSCSLVLRRGEAAEALLAKMREALKEAQAELFEAADKFRVLHLNMPDGSRLVDPTDKQFALTMAHRMSESAIRARTALGADHAPD